MRQQRMCSLVGLGVAAVLAGGTRVLGSEGGDGPSLFTGDLGNIIWSLLTFFAVLVVLGKFAWKPILGALQNREEFIHSALQKAKDDREAAESRLEEYEARLTAARQEATEIVAEGRRDAEDVKHTIEDEAKASAAAMLERAKREIGIATDTAVKELYDVTGKLATDMASRIISKEINAQDHERLIAESIRELSAAGGNGKSGA